MPRLPLLVLLLSAVVARAQTPEDAPARLAPPPLLGKIVGTTYVSPTGAYKVAMPVLPELGGTVSDTEFVVTFEDDFNVHVSIASFPQDASQRWEMSTRGTKDYLIYFFSNYVMLDFVQR